VAATLAIVLVGKPLAALAIVLLLRYPLRVALAVSVALAQIGEFSFILAALGRDLEVLTDESHSALVAAAIVSISLNPILYRLVDLAEARAKHWPMLRGWLNGRLAAGLPGSAPARPDGPGSAAIVVGYGPVGSTLVRLLRENDIEPTVVELNLDTVHRLRGEGVRAVYGDATHRETLEEAGAGRAVVFILTSAGMRGSEESIRVAREVNPKIRVFARAAYLRETPALRRAGADAVFSGEGEVALAVTEFLMRQLGATAEQIDRETDRIRTELFGGARSGEPLLPLSSAAEDRPPDGAQRPDQG
jgi:CPA2 family monovalent cation:H+ antiporter-2